MFFDNKLFLVIIALVVSTLSCTPVYAFNFEIAGDVLMHKIIHYRKAIWLLEDEYRPILEDVLKDALISKPNVEDTKLQYSPSIDVQLSNRSIGENNTGCYFVMYKEGNSAGTIENGGPGIGSANAPEGDEFLKTGIHLIIQGNHLVYLADGHTNDGQITNLMHKFLLHAGTDTTLTQFAFMPRANRREVDRLLRVGVKSIDMGFADFVTVANDLSENNQRHPVTDAVYSLFSPISNALGNDRSLDEIRAASEIEARMHLSFDGRGAADLVPQIMGQIANTVYDEYTNDFKIITKHDVVVTRDKLVLKKEVNIEESNSSVDSESAFSELRFALNDWRDSGVLDD